MTPSSVRLALQMVLASVATVSGIPLAVSAQSPAPRLAVEYLANEGVLLSAGSDQVLIDALFGDGLREYLTVPMPVRDSLERALGRFGEIDLILVTHVHRDHFDPMAVARHLAANPTAHIAAPSEVIDSLRVLGRWSDPSRTHSIAPDRNRVARLRVGAVSVEGHGIPHPAGPRRQHVEHLVWVLSMGGVRVMHTGDSSPSAAELGAAAGSGINLLLGSSWILTGSEGAERIAATRASQVAAIHLRSGDTGVPASRAVQLLVPGQRIEVR